MRRTKADAGAALKDLREDVQSGRINLSRQPLGAYLRSWLDETAKPSVSANTARGYEAVLMHLAPIADIPLADLTAEDIEHVLNRMTSRRHGQKESGTASPMTKRNALLMLRAALGHAERRGHIARNPAKLVPLPRVARYKLPALTPTDAKAILAAVAGDRFEAAYALALVGLRASEVLGLAWSDLDLDAGVANLQYQLVGSGKTATRAQLKTAASERPMPLPPFVVTRLVEHRTRQRVERIAAGVPTEEGLVFSTEAGYAVNGSWLTRHFHVLLAAVGLPRMRLHDLRHGAAWLLVDAGANPRVVQGLLRHATSKVSMEVYAHTTAAQDREA